MRSELLIDRRTLLRGAGAALALPLLETMGWAEKRAAKPPVRLGFMYMPHGVIPEQFWPEDAGSFLDSPPPILESLTPVLDQCLLVKGISGVPIAPLNGAPHALELSTWLTAALPDSNRRDVVNIAISADQIAANYIGAFTALPSLELATMPQTPRRTRKASTKPTTRTAATRRRRGRCRPRSIRAASSSGSSRLPASRARRSTPTRSTAACSTWSWAAPRTCAAS